MKWTINRRRRVIGSVLPKGAALINPIRECLFDLLTNLERIGDDHEELFDSEVRELVVSAEKTFANGNISTKKFANVFGTKIT